MEQEETNSNQIKMIVISPGLFAIFMAILTSTLAGAGWLIAETRSSAEDFGKELGIQLGRTEYFTSKNIEITKELLQCKKQQEISKEENKSLNNKLVINNESLANCTVSIDENSAFKQTLAKQKQTLITRKQTINNLKVELKTIKQTNVKLQKYVDEQKLSLQSCGHRALSFATDKRVSDPPYYRKKLEKGPIVHINGGEAWIKLLEIGHDKNGNFAIIRTSIFADDKIKYCIRKDDIFKVNTALFMQISSITEIVVTDFGTRLYLP